MTCPAQKVGSHPVATGVDVFEIIHSAGNQYLGAALKGRTKLNYWHKEPLPVGGAKAL